MNHWPMRRLGELVTLEYGKALKAEIRSHGGRFPVYGSNGVVGFHDQAIVEMPTIVVGRKGAIGEAHLAEGGCWPIDTAFYTTVHHPHLINLRYLLLWFRSVDLKTLSITSTIPGINRNTLYEQYVPVPPLAEQDRIVEFLNKADELRKLRTRADHRTADFMPALFHEMFGDPETNLQKWPSGTFKSFGGKTRYGLGQPPELEPNGVPMLRATNIKKGRISEDGLIRVRRDAIPPSRQAFLDPDEVLVVRSGAYAGDIARVGEKWRGSVAGYDLVLSPQANFTGAFVEQYLLTDFVQLHYFNGLKRRAAQPHLNSEQVANTPFFCPPFPLQKEFSRRVESVREIQQFQSICQRRADEMFDSILHRAFEGKL